MRVELAEETCLPREEHLPARDAGSSLWNPERQCDRRLLTLEPRAAVRPPCGCRPPVRRSERAAAAAST